MAYIFRGKIRDEIPGPLCGTRRGYFTHYRERTTACQPCKDAASSYQRQLRRKQEVVTRSTCGTYAGYMRHKRHEGTACGWCLTAYAQYMSDYRARKKVAA